MALALALDPAFVGAHHVLRILGLNAVGASWLRRGAGRLLVTEPARPYPYAHSQKETHPCPTLASPS